jgi:hypothetical protein
LSGLRVECGRDFGEGYPAAAAIIVAEVGSDTQGRAASLRVYSHLDADLSTDTKALMT